MYTVSAKITINNTKTLNIYSLKTKHKLVAYLIISPLCTHSPSRGLMRNEYVIECAAITEKVAFQPLSSNILWLSILRYTYIYAHKIFTNSHVPCSRIREGARTHAQTNTACNYLHTYTHVYTKTSYKHVHVYSRKYSRKYIILFLKFRLM